MHELQVLPQGQPSINIPLLDPSSKQPELGALHAELASLRQAVQQLTASCKGVATCVADAALRLRMGEDGSTHSEITAP